jgi:hypothetical protein
MATIMVQMTDGERTLEALHLACALAHAKQDTVALVKMVPVQHIGLLGTELGFMNLTDADCKEMADFEAVAKHYGVEVEAHPFQYATLAEGVAQAADYVDARIVFASLPTSVVPYWYRVQCWILRRQLARHDRQLYLLERDSGSAHWSPAILVPMTHYPGSSS